jgi:2-C-methyl-D-erythritol 4-phosphate cytidylyltransferase
VTKNKRPPRAAAIIVAGGKGLRFGGPVRKQYLKLQGRPLIRWSASAFDASPSIGWMVLVVPADDVADLRRMATRWNFKKSVMVVRGGETRADSVRQGLAALPPECRWVCVHDAVRPLVTRETIEKTLREARRTGAAIAACLSKDTVKLADARGHIHSTPARETVWLAQTPQTFERKLLERAHRRGRHLPVTDDAQLVERLGIRVQLVATPPENIKVTTRIDLTIARAVIKGYP